MTGPDKKKVLGKPRVIITEDERHLRDLFKVMMLALNTEVVALAANGHEAVDFYRKVRPHLMLLDINLPGKTGDEALEEIMAEFPHAFIIMLSSVSDLEMVKKCLDLGASNYILKDTPISEMKEIIKSTWKSRLENMRQRRLHPSKKVPVVRPVPPPGATIKAPLQKPFPPRTSPGLPPRKKAAPGRPAKRGIPAKPVQPGAQTGRPVKPAGVVPVKRPHDRQPIPSGTKNNQGPPSGAKPKGTAVRRPEGNTNPPLKKPVSGQGPPNPRPGGPAGKKKVKTPSDK